MPGNPSKPGARRSGLDFSYRLPGVRNGATFYAEGMAQHDEITPLLGPDVACWFAGLYLPTLPGTRKMDLRLEGGYTEPSPFFRGRFPWCVLLGWDMDHGLSERGPSDGQLDGPARAGRTGFDNLLAGPSR